MRNRSVHAKVLSGLLAAALTSLGTPAAVFAQSARPAHLDLHVTSAMLAQAGTAGSAAPSQPAAAPAEQTRRLTIEEAVKLALENNLGIQIARFDPQVQDTAVAQAKAAWVPSFQNKFQKNSQDSPNNSFL